MASIDGAVVLNMSASAQVKAGSGIFYGFTVNSNSSGTIKVWDALTATGRVIMNTYTFPAGSSVVTLPASAVFGTGLFVTIGGTADISVLYI